MEMWQGKACQYIRWDQVFAFNFDGDFLFRFHDFYVKSKNNTYWKT